MRRTFMNVISVIQAREIVAWAKVVGGRLWEVFRFWIYFEGTAKMI